MVVNSIPSIASHFLLLLPLGTPDHPCFFLQKNHLLFRKPRGQSFLNRSFGHGRNMETAAGHAMLQVQAPRSRDVAEDSQSVAVDPGASSQTWQGHVKAVKKFESHLFRKIGLHIGPLRFLDMQKVLGIPRSPTGPTPFVALKCIDNRPADQPTYPPGGLDAGTPRPLPYGPWLSQTLGPDGSDPCHPRSSHVIHWIHWLVFLKRQQTFNKNQIYEDWDLPQKQTWDP